MKAKSFKMMAAALLACFLASCTGGNQGVNEAGSADSNSMMNTDTQMVDTSGLGTSGTDGVSTDTSGGGSPGTTPVPTP